MNININDVLNSATSEALQNSLAFCKQHKYEFITIDTFFYFLGKQAYLQEVYKKLNINIQELESQQLAYIQEVVSKSDKEIGVSIILKKILEIAVTSARIRSNDDKKIVVVESDMLKALYQTTVEDSVTKHYLVQHGIEEGHMINFLDLNQLPQQTKEAEGTNPMDNPALAKYLVNLNEKFKTVIDVPIFGRDHEIEQMVHILSRKQKKNPVLVGDAGVGKTSIVEGFVKNILQNRVHSSLKNALVYEVSITNILSGARFRGDVEERVGAILTWAKQNPDVILFIDEIHSILTPSNQSNGDFSSILKPALSSGDIKIIGATTFKEYRHYFTKDEAFSRRFQQIDVKEPTMELAIDIIKSAKPVWEDFHKVEITDEAIKTAVELSHKFITDRKLPDKAFDLIDIAGASLKLRDKTLVTESDIKETVTKFLGIPVVDLVQSEKEKLKNFEFALKKEVFGQNEAIDKVTDMILLSRANLYTREKPIASFLFAGPSGVGKTELAKQIAKQLNIGFIRFDMSEYMERHAVSKFIGSPPGYMGSDKGGRLIDAAKQNPNAVFLFDEIEKAHPDVLNTFLQIMDYGSVTDSQGNKADFKNIIVILTSNMGAEAISYRRIGFNNAKEEPTVQKDRTEAIKKQLRPEFINRLDSIIQFNSLNDTNVNYIVIKSLNQLQISLRNKGITLQYSEDVIEWLAKKGFDKNYGARPLERCVEQNIAQILAKEIIFGKLSEGANTVKISVKNNELVFNYSTKATKKIMKKDAGLEQSIS